MYVRWVLSLLIFNMLWTHIILPVRLSLFSTTLQVEVFSQVIDLMCDVCNLIDCLMVFFIPLNDTRGGWNSAYVFERNVVILDYLKSWFFIDMFANIPYSFYYLDQWPKLYLVVMAMKLTRLRKADSGLKKLVRKLGFGVVTVRFTISVWNMFMMLHLTACMWGTIGQINLD